MPSANSTLRSPAMLTSMLLGLLVVVCHLVIDRAHAVPLLDKRAAVVAVARPTPVPRRLPVDPTPDDLYAFYAPSHQDEADAYSWSDVVLADKRSDAGEWAPTPSKRQSDQPSVPLAAMGQPTFPADIPSCPKCEAAYTTGGISSCMRAASVFANATSIFNSPLAYIEVIKCACTDTFESAFPQCVDCFQHTHQCYYLGTDPQGTGAGNLVSNIRNICSFGSALLGGVASANSNVGTVTPGSPGMYTDVSTTGAGYHDQSTGAIFQSNAKRIARVHGVAWYATMLAVSVLAVAAGGWRTVAGL